MLIFKYLLLLFLIYIFLYPNFVHLEVLIQLDEENNIIENILDEKNRERNDENIEINENIEIDQKASKYIEHKEPLPSDHPFSVDKSLQSNNIQETEFYEYNSPYYPYSLTNLNNVNILSYNETIQSNLSNNQPILHVYISNKTKDENLMDKYSKNNRLNLKESILDNLSNIDQSSNKSSFLFIQDDNTNHLLKNIKIEEIYIEEKKSEINSNQENTKPIKQEKRHKLKLKYNIKRKLTKKEIENQNIKEEIKIMFREAYQNYKEFAFPMDELNPISCTGRNTWGNYSLTLIDSLDSLVIVEKNYPLFFKELFWALNNVNFDHDIAVSVFETNIRIVGGLISSYLLLKERNGIYHSIYQSSIEEVDEWIYKLYDSLINGKSFSPSKDDLGYISNYAQDRVELRYKIFFIQMKSLDECREEFLNLMERHTLEKMEKLGNKLLEAFNTKTGIPYGAINLKYGIAKNESSITATAAAGTTLLEFGLLSYFTNNSKYLQATRRSLHSIFKYRHPTTGLLGNHINIISGQWTHRESGIGGLVDSIFEYLMKGWMLFGEPEYLDMFEIYYESIQKYIYRSPWYVDVDMNSGSPLMAIYNSLQSFWPGTLSSVGRIDLARETLLNFHSVWRKYGALPEGYNIYLANPQDGQAGYPLRPELAESAYHLYRSTGDPIYQNIGRDIIKSLQYNTRTNCGYANIKNVQNMQLEDKMESFFIAETLKYLYLLFDEENIFNKFPHTFNTEAHPIPLIFYGLGDLFPDSRSDPLSKEPVLLQRRKNIKNYQYPTQSFFSSSRFGKNDLVHPNINNNL